MQIMHKSLKSIWCRGTELNCRHGDFQSPALPTELPRLSFDAVCVPHRWRSLVPICRDIGKLFLQILCNNLKSLPVPAILPMLPLENGRCFFVFPANAGRTSGCSVAVPAWFRLRQRRRFFCAARCRNGGPPASSALGALSRVIPRYPGCHVRRKCLEQGCVSENRQSFSSDQA